jgi:2'-5' RNA ligase
LFLGELEARAVPDLATAFSAVAHRHGPVALRVAGACTFGPPRRPRVLAAELTGDLQGLGDLFADATHEVHHLVPIESDRPFRPHVTLARARSSHGDPLLGRCRTALNEALWGEFVLERLTLYRSELLASGAVHTALAAWLLGQHPGNHEGAH